MDAGGYEVLGPDGELARPRERQGKGERGQRGIGERRRKGGKMRTEGNGRRRKGGKEEKRE